MAMEFFFSLRNWGRVIRSAFRSVLYILCCDVMQGRQNLGLLEMSEELLIVWYGAVVVSVAFKSNYCKWLAAGARQAGRQTDRQADISHW